MFFLQQQTASQTCYPNLTNVLSKKCTIWNINFGLIAQVLDYWRQRLRLPLNIERLSYFHVKFQTDLYKTAPEIENLYVQIFIEILTVFWNSVKSGVTIK